jgi:GcrA cell cycle regulator
MSWTDERVEVLKQLWADGLSSNKIAKELGNVTRNAVIGKVSRLGLSGRIRKSQLKKAVESKPKEPRKKRFTHDFRDRMSPLSTAGRIQYKRMLALSDALGQGADPLPDEDTYCPASERKTLLALDDNDCRFVYGESEFMFCSKPVVPDCSYCSFHAARVYEPRKEVNKFMCAAE